MVELTNAYAAKRTLSGLIILSKIIFLRLSHFWSHSPGNESDSGVGLKYHFFHSFPLWVNALMIPVKFGNLSKSQMAYHYYSVTQSEIGLWGWFFLSAVGSPPLKKKLYSSKSIVI